MKAKYSRTVQLEPFHPHSVELEMEFDPAEVTPVDAVLHLAQLTEEALKKAEADIYERRYNS